MDMINHPEHYTRCSVTYEPADLTERMIHPLASAIEYLLRAGHKEGSKRSADLAKAAWWLERIDLTPDARNYYHSGLPVFINEHDTHGWRLLEKFAEKRRFVGMLSECIKRGDLADFEKFKEVVKSIKAAAAFEAQAEKEREVSDGLSE